APRLRGCMIPEHLAAGFFASSSDHQTYQTGDEPMKGGSGDPEFDYALAHTLVKIGAALEVLPGFAYYDDGDRPQAKATNVKRLARAAGTVLSGLRLLRQTRIELEHPEVAVTAVCAHEFGHILQYKTPGLLEALLEGQVTDKRVELHADFLAGYFAGI